MSFKFESKDFSVEDTLFGNYLLRVPQFQRPYAWEEDQCSDFWNDLVDDDSFFIGQFILNYENFPKEKIVDIVDGQQRTTTILILCAVLRDASKELGYSDEAEVIQSKAMVAKMSFTGPQYRIVVSPTLSDFFQKHIQNEDNVIKSDITYEKNSEQEKVVKNYLCLKSRLSESLENLSPSQQIEKIKNIYESLESAQVIVTKIHDENDAYEIFESVNATGINLNVADLLKNFLFKKMKIESGSTIEVAEKWSEITDLIPPTELTKFIRYYWLSKEDPFISESKLFKAIKNLNITSWLTFLNELLESARLYNDLRNPLDADFSNVEGVEKLRNALIGIREMNITQCYVLLLCIYRNKDRISTNWISTFELIERFNFLYHAISKLPANRVEKLYHDHAFRIEKLVRLESDEKALRVALETEFKTLKNKLKELVPPKETFILGFTDLNYKKKGLCRYALSKIEESYGTSEYVLNQPTITIEHVLPQKPGKDWNLTQSQVKSYVHNIGNLTLLGRKPNGTVQNKSISEKIRILKTSTEIKITQQLLFEIEKTGIWNEETIRQRSYELAETAYNHVWKIL